MWRERYEPLAIPSDRVGPLAGTTEPLAWPTRRTSSVPHEDRRTDREPCRPRPLRAIGPRPPSRRRSPAPEHRRRNHLDSGPAIVLTAAFGPDRIDDVKSCSSSWPVPAVKGLVGDARSDPDLTPTQAGPSCCFDRSLKSVVGVHHHCGRLGHHSQLVGRFFDLGIVRLNIRQWRWHLDVGRVFRRLDLRLDRLREVEVEEAQRLKPVFHARCSGRDRGYSGRATPGPAPG